MVCRIFTSVVFGLQWNENFFAYAFDEISLEDRCSRYLNRYLVALTDSINGELLLEKSLASGRTHCERFKKMQALRSACFSFREGIQCYRFFVIYSILQDGGGSSSDKLPRCFYVIVLSLARYFL